MNFKDGKIERGIKSWVRPSPNYLWSIKLKARISQVSLVHRISNGTLQGTQMEHVASLMNKER